MQQKVRTAVSELIAATITKTTQTRQPLRLQERKPIPIQSYNPRFDEKYVAVNFHPLF